MSSSSSRNPTPSVAASLGSLATATKQKKKKNDQIISLAKFSTYKAVAPEFELSKGLAHEDLCLLARASNLRRSYGLNDSGEGGLADLSNTFDSSSSFAFNDRSGEFPTASSHSHRLLIVCASYDSDNLICQLVGNLDSYSLNE